MPSGTGPGQQVRQLCSRFNVVSAGYDPWQSAQMSQRLRAEGVPMHEFRATTQNFSPAIIELEAAMRAGRLRHDGNPVLTWCIGNGVGRPDRRGNLYPTKSRPDQKIDAGSGAHDGSRSRSGRGSGVSCAERVLVEPYRVSIEFGASGYGDQPPALRASTPGYSRGHPDEIN